MPGKVAVAELARLGPFRKVPREDLESVAPHCVETQVLGGKFLYTGCEQSSQVWLVCSGLMSLTQESPSGKTVTVDLATAGEFLNICAWFVDEAEPASAQALSPSRVIGIPEKLFRPLLDGNPELFETIIEEICRRLMTSRKMRVLASETAEDRILAILKCLNERLGAELPVTRRTIGEMAGVSVETTIRVLSPLEKKGWIRTNRGRLQIIRSDRISGLNGSSLPGCKRG